MKITKDQIKKARTSLGLSQEDVGRKLALSGSAISLLETGQTSPIDVSEDDSQIGAWQALLSGDAATIARLPTPFAAWLRSARTKNQLTVAHL